MRFKAYLVFGDPRHTYVSETHVSEFGEVFFALAVAYIFYRLFSRTERNGKQIAVHHNFSMANRYLSAAFRCSLKGNNAGKILTEVVNGFTVFRLKDFYRRHLFDFFGQHPVGYPHFGIYFYFFDSDGLKAHVLFGYSCVENLSVVKIRRKTLEIFRDQPTFVRADGLFATVFIL